MALRWRGWPFMNLLSKSDILFCVVQSFSHVQLSVTPRTAAYPCPSLFLRACSISCPLSRWCHPTISFSIVPFSSGLQSFPAWGSFPMSWLFTSGGQSIGASDSASVFLMNIQGWFPLGLTGLISLQSKELSRVFFSTIVRRHQFFEAQPFLLFSFHTHTRKNHSFDYMGISLQSNVSAF